MFEPKRILYAGTRALSARCLSYLIDRVGSGRFAGILCIPHGERGWWAKEGAPELWEIAERHAIPSLVPADLEGLDYDFIVSVMWDKLFSSGELARAALGGFNFHPAPLPSYRGSFARTHAILNGERSFGVTIHALSEGADQGDIISSSSFPVLEGDTALTLDLRAQAYGYPLFCETWLRLTDGSATRRKQSDIVAETGLRPRFYRLAEAKALMQEPSHPLSSEELVTLARALYLPPRFLPPPWLMEELERRQLGAHANLSFTRPETAEVPCLLTVETKGEI